MKEKQFFLNGIKTGDLKTIYETWGRKQACATNPAYLFEAVTKYICLGDVCCS
jgi:hypothetical protein